MKNKYVLSRSQNVKFVNDNLDDFINNCMNLSRYEKDDKDYALALKNFEKTYKYIMDSKDAEINYDYLIKLHNMLMDGLEKEIENILSDEQKKYLMYMINQPAKSNLEISIDVMLYILSKRLFKDGDVRVALAFANKIMIENGCGFISIEKNYIDTYREKLHKFKNNEENDLKDWIYKYCIKGIKNDYLN